MFAYFQCDAWLVCARQLVNWFTVAVPPGICYCAVTELNLPHTNGGAAFEGCASGLEPELAAIMARLTHLDLSRGSAPMPAADAVALICACSSLKWLGAPAVRQPGTATSQTGLTTVSWALQALLASITSPDCSRRECEHHVQVVDQELAR